MITHLFYMLGSSRLVTASCVPYQISCNGGMWCEDRERILLLPDEIRTRAPWIRSPAHYPWTREILEKVYYITRAADIILFQNIFIYLKTWKCFIRGKFIVINGNKNKNLHFFYRTKCAVLNFEKCLFLDNVKTVYIL